MTGEGGTAPRAFFFCFGKLYRKGTVEGERSGAGAGKDELTSILLDFGIRDSARCCDRSAFSIGWTALDCAVPC